jgi:hypothetical protein
VSACTCDGPGWCAARKLRVSELGHRVCSLGTADDAAAYFAAASSPERHYRRGAAEAAQVGADMRPKPRTRPACRWLGSLLVHATGLPVLRECRTCSGNVRMKVSACHHPDHSLHPTTTATECNQCKDYIAMDNPPAVAGGAPGLRPLPSSMVAPWQKRAGVWRGGILQIHVTRACDLACFHCSQGSNLGGKPVVMSPDQFDAACASLEGYFGVVGVFGGNPAMSPHFAEYCRILRERFPYEQRGLWCNHPRGKGAVCRITFNPGVSNLNVHLSAEARAEFVRDWPECARMLKGEATDSVHGSPWVAMRDVIADEEKRWGLIAQCDINRHWSAMVCVVRGELRAFFCEIAGAMAMLHQDNPDWCGTGAPMPDVGLEAVPGWWKRGMDAFDGQVRTCCHACGIPMRRPGQLAIGGELEEFSSTHRYIARSRVKGRPVEVVELQVPALRVDRPATEYLPGTTPRV